MQSSCSRLLERRAECLAAASAFNHKQHALIFLHVLAKIFALVLSRMMIACFPVQALAELLTTNKLSELACLTLYLMYEKKNGKQSVWFEFIKASDSSTCRGHVMASDLHDTSGTTPRL